MKIVSLFSGAGGLDLGFIKAGHDIIWANDLYKDAVNTYRKNIGNHIILADIQEIDTKDIPDCDIVIGGFPWRTGKGTWMTNGMFCINSLFV